MRMEFKNKSITQNIYKNQRLLSFILNKSNITINGKRIDCGKLLNFLGVTMLLSDHLLNYTVYFCFSVT